MNQPNKESAPPETGDEWSSATEIDEVCKRFEGKLNSGIETSIESVISEWEEPERSKLLSELVSIETRIVHGNATREVQESYLERFPNDADAIQEAFSEASMQTILVNPSEETLTSESELTKLRFLAQGGLGQVFVGEDSQLRREAAVKLIRNDLAKNERSCQQFRIEAEVTGRLAHPGIPTVYAIGTSPLGRLYYAMQYVHGTSLERLIRQHHKVYSRDTRSQQRRFRGMQSASSSVTASGSKEPGGEPTRPIGPNDSKDQPALELRDLLQIFISICQTIGYAHRRGILHRDIKPSNVIHGKFGETVVIDWGLALRIRRQGAFKDDIEKSLDPYSGKSDTSSAGFAGTPAFMSPEQADGNIPLTPASDIFSLGCTLYYILTGQPPYKGNSAREVRTRAIASDYTPARELCPTLPVELEAICHHAMSRHSIDRYQSAGDLVADLNCYLSDRPISVLPDSLISKAARWMRHNSEKVLALLLGLLLVAMAVSGYALTERFALQQQKTETAQELKMKNHELALRKDALKMAADLAARTLSNKIDVLYRVLERERQQPELISAVRKINGTEPGSPDFQNAMRDVQDWLSETVSDKYTNLEIRSWFVMSRKGKTVARVPMYDANNRKIASIGRNYSFRDYFHGKGQDYNPDVSMQPLSVPHNSVASISSVDGTALVMFSVPVVDESSNDPIGVISISVSCGKFLDLNVQQPERQQLLLVETRSYPMPKIKWDDDQQKNVTIGKARWGAGIVLHHEHLETRSAQESDEVVRINDDLLSVLQSHPDSDHKAQEVPEEIVYSDPVDGDANGDKKWIAAFAPVVLESRRDNDDVSLTGWFVIVQQEMLSN